MKSTKRFQILSILIQFFCVNGHIHSTPIKFMLDSGAAVSVVNYQMVRHIPFTAIKTMAVGVNGSPLNVVSADILVGEFATNQEFIVVKNLAVDCLLGADFLRTHGAILDCCNNTLSFGGDTGPSIPIMLTQRTISQCPDSVNAILRAASDIEIPGRAVQLISGRVEATHENGVTVLIEPTPSLPAHVYPACSLGTIHDGNVTIQVMNTSPSPVTIFKGMRLGAVTPKDNILFVSIQDSAAPEDRPYPSNNSPCFNNITTPDLSVHERNQLLNLLTKFQGIFAPATGPQGCTSTVKHSIPTVGGNPCAVCLRH